MDKMHIRDLKAECIIGTRPEERRTKQSVIINITLECDLLLAGESDRLDYTVNYNDLKEEILMFAGHSECFLIERLAERIADICMRRERVAAVTVTLDKPAAIAEARSAGVEITRRKKI